MNPFNDELTKLNENHPIYNRAKGQLAWGQLAWVSLLLVIETAKANDLMPFDYLMFLLEQVSQLDYEIEQCLPWIFAKR